MSAPPSPELRKRVSAVWRGAHPCPVCGRDDGWCRVSDNGAVLCRRHCGEGGREITCKDGTTAFMHDGHGAVVAAPEDPPSPIQVAAPDVRDRVYRALLRACPITPEHGRALQARGLTSDEVTRMGLGSHVESDPVPDMLRNLGEHRSLYDVPGFVQRSASAREYRFAGAHGLLIPVRDVEGRVVALRIRVDNPGTSGRYRWASCPEGFDGAKAEQHVHVPLHTEEQRAAIRAGAPVRITEGELKAEVATLRTGVLTISIPGVGVWKRALDALRALGAKRVRVAFDADARINPAVATALRALVTGLAGADITVDVETWPTTNGPDGKPSPKGIDDALAAWVPITVHEGKDAFEQAQVIAAQGGAQPDPVADAVLLLEQRAELLRASRTNATVVLEDERVLAAAATLLRHRPERWHVVAERLTRAGLKASVLQKAAKARIAQEDEAERATNRAKVGEKLKAEAAQRYEEIRGKHEGSNDPDTAAATLAEVAERIRASKDPAQTAATLLVETPTIRAGAVLFRQSMPQAPDSPPTPWSLALGALRDAGAGPSTLATFTEACRFRAEAERAVDEGLGENFVPNSLDAFTEADVARLLVERHGREIRFSREGDGLGRWYLWDGRRWCENAQDDVGHLALQIAYSMVGSVASLITESAKTNAADEISYADAKRFVARLLSASFADGVLKQARRNPDVAVRPEQWDADPWVLNVANGILDLRTGALRPHDPEALCTKLVPVPWDPLATAPRWERFLEEAQPDVTIRSFLQRFAGYCATGVIREHVFVIHWGKGRNGKGVFTNALMHALGDYAAQIPTEMLMESRGDRHPTERAMLQGVRFASASEVEEGKSFNTAVVKKLTGGDPIEARKMRMDFYEFQPTHKLALQTNPRPKVREISPAVFERIRMVPWGVSFAGREDPTLGDTLASEVSGILRWIVDGCLAWQGPEKLTPPKAILDATEEVRTENDVLGGFVGERCVEAPASGLRPAGRCRTSEVFGVYLRWATEQGLERPMNARGLVQALKQRGWATKENGHGNFFVGWRLLTDAEVADREKADSQADRSETASVVDEMSHGGDGGDGGATSIGALENEKILSELPEEISSCPAAASWQCPPVPPHGLKNVGAASEIDGGGPREHGTVDAAGGRPPPRDPPSAVADDTPPGRPCATEGCPYLAVPGEHWCVGCL